MKLERNKIRAQDTVIVIDTANLVFRLAYSFKGTMIQIDNGIFVNSGVIYQVVNTIIQLYEKFNPIGIVFVFEGDKKNNPRYDNPEYKSKRPSRKTLDITSELVLIKELIQYLGIVCLVPERGEADDGIATAVSLLRAHYRLLILSNDHDMQALLSKRVSIIKSKFELFTKQDFEKKYGFHPKHLSLLLAVAGDASDNLPGIKGIGEKKGASIFLDILEQNKEPTPKRIAIQLRLAYKKYDEMYTDKEITKIIKRYYKVTKLHTDWGTKTFVKKINIELLTWTFMKMKMKRFLAIMPQIKSMILSFYQKQKSLVRYLR